MHASLGKATFSRNGPRDGDCDGRYDVVRGYDTNRIGCDNEPALSVHDGLKAAFSAFVASDRDARVATDSPTATRDGDVPKPSRSPPHHKSYHTIKVLLV